MSEWAQRVVRLEEKAAQQDLQIAEMAKLASKLAVHIADLREEVRTTGVGSLVEAVRRVVRRQGYGMTHLSDALDDYEESTRN